LRRKLLSGASTATERGSMHNRSQDIAVNHSVCRDAEKSLLESDCGAARFSTVRGSMLILAMSPAIICFFRRASVRYRSTGMNHGPHDHLSPVFHLDVSPSAVDMAGSGLHSGNRELVELMRQLVAGQDRQNELLEDLIEQINSGQRQRAAELGQWKEANPILARRCRAAAEALGRVQTSFIENLALEISDNHEAMMDGEFVLNEFVDRFGPRLAHLNGVLQLLSQLSSMPANPRSEV
jgi:hypothetical protein